MVKYSPTPRRLNIFQVRVFMSSGSTGGDAKTIISPNTSFGDINIIIIDLVITE